MDNQLPLFELDPTRPSRQAESEVIRADYHREIFSPNRQTEYKYSAEWLASRPKSAIEKWKVTPEEQEEIIYAYAATRSIPKTCRETGANVQKVRAVIFDEECDKMIQSLRLKMRAEVITKISETQFDLLEAIQDPGKLERATLRELSGVFTEISQAQVNLVAAQREVALGPIANVNPEDVFTGEELQYMAMMRKRAEIASRGRGLSVEADPMAGHEFIDAMSTELDPGYEPTPSIIDQEIDFSHD